MALVELIRGLQTSDATYAAAEALSGARQDPDLVRNSPGFVVNRMLCPMINEAVFALPKGSPRRGDRRGMKLGCNHPIGPLALADLIGLDMMLAVMQVFYGASTTPSTGRRRCSRRWSRPAIWAARRGGGSTPTPDVVVLTPRSAAAPPGRGCDAAVVGPTRPALSSACSAWFTLCLETPREIAELLLGELDAAFGRDRAGG